MKKLLGILSFCLGLSLLPFIAFANQTSVTNYYPSPSGAYTKVHLINQSNGPNENNCFCTQFSTNPANCSTGLAVNNTNYYTNAGTIFTDPTTGYLEICKNDGTVATYPGSCFNRFGTVVASPPCPTNYQLATNSQNASFSMVSGGNPIASWSCCFTGGQSTAAQSGCFSIYSTSPTQPNSCPSNAYDLGCTNVGSSYKRDCCYSASSGGSLTTSSCTCIPTTPCTGYTCGTDSCGNSCGSDGGSCTSGSCSGGSGTPGTCASVQCPAQSLSLNGTTASFTATDAGPAVSNSCASGSGTASATCNADGTWSSGATGTCCPVNDAWNGSACILNTCLAKPLSLNKTTASFTKTNAGITNSSGVCTAQYCTASCSSAGGYCTGPGQDCIGAIGRQTCLPANTCVDGVGYCTGSSSCTTSSGSASAACEADGTWGSASGSCCPSGDIFKNNKCIAGCPATPINVQASAPGSEANFVTVNLPATAAGQSSPLEACSSGQGQESYYCNSNGQWGAKTGGTCCSGGETWCGITNDWCADPGNSCSS